MITPQINSQTNCPTCGSTVQVQSADEGTHSFIPINIDKTFFKRVESFISNVKVNDMMSEEEKEYILLTCKQDIIR